MASIEEKWKWISLDNPPSIGVLLTGSIRDTISARSVKEALGHVTT